MKYAKSAQLNSVFGLYFEFFHYFLHLLELSKGRQLLSGIKVEFDQCARTDSLLALESVNLYRKIGHKAELRTTKALTSQQQWNPTKYVHPCYSNWKLPKATAL